MRLYIYIYIDISYIYSLYIVYCNLEKDNDKVSKLYINNSSDFKIKVYFFEISTTL